MTVRVLLCATVVRDTITVRIVRDTITVRIRGKWRGWESSGTNAAIPRRTWTRIDTTTARRINSRF